MDTISEQIASSEQLASAKEGDWVVGLLDGRRFEGPLYLDEDGDFRVDIRGGGSVILQYWGEASAAVSDLHVRSMPTGSPAPRAPGMFREKHPECGHNAMRDEPAYWLVSMKAVVIAAQEFATNPTPLSFMQLRADLDEHELVAR